MKNNDWLIYMFFLLALLFAYDASAKKKEMRYYTPNIVCVNGVQYYYYSAIRTSMMSPVIDHFTLNHKRCRFLKYKCTKKFFSKCKRVEIKKPEGK